MKNFLLLFVMLAIVGQAQQISLDTSTTSDIPGTIEQYRYWASGVQVIGEGFSPNSEITVIAADPTGWYWREFTGTTDADGGFTIQVNAMKNRSVLGEHTVTATDASENTANAILTVIANVNEVLDVLVSSPELSISEFTNSGFTIVASGLAPNALARVNLQTPYATGMELDVEIEKYADENGYFTMDVNTYTTATPLGIIPMDEGLWTVSVHDFSGNSHYGSTTFRLLPDNPDPSSYCEPTIQYGVQPITLVDFAGINNPTSGESTLGYEDFTGMEGTVTAGETYTLTLKGKAQWGYQTNTYTVFIDWNRNGILDEENEVYSVGFLVGSTGEDDMEVVYDITVPSNVTAGQNRIRILKVLSASPTAMFWPHGACGIYAYGQIEDYTLNIEVNTPVCSIECPEDIVVEAEEGSTVAVVEYEVGFNCEDDNGEGVELVLAEGLASGSEFPVGVTTIVYNLVFNDEILDTCSFTITVEEAQMSIADLNGSQISVYPNPVKDTLNISHDKEISGVSVYDLSGKQVYTKSINDKTTQLNLSHLLSGTYVVKAVTDKQVHTFKIIKQ